MNSAEKFELGEYDCWALSDGQFSYPGSLIFPSEAQPPEHVPMLCTALLIDTGTTRVLIDTGAGTMTADTGKLPESLQAAGFKTDDIDVAILSHAHADHIGGLHEFPRAELIMLQEEFDFWMGAETQRRLEAGQLYGLGPIELQTATCIREQLVPARERLRLLHGESEVAPGILVVPAPGHTPGHAAVLISSRGQQLLYIGDSVVHLLHFDHPGWVSLLDLSPEQTVTTRRQLFDRAASDRCLLAGFHLPGGVGNVEARQSRYSWEPLSARSRAVAK